MIVFTVLGSAPLGADRVAILETDARDVLVSFFDYPQSFSSLASLNINIQGKFHERQNNLPGRTHSRSK